MNSSTLKYCDSILVAVPELGNKTRVVTKNESLRVAHGHRVRRTYEPVINNQEWSTTSDSKLDPELSVIDFTKAQGSDLVVFSGDFTNATGELSHEFLDLLAETLQIPGELLHKGFTVKGKPMTSGAFQGMPASWTVGLQMGHYCIARYVDPTHSFRIKGDDIIALWSLEQISLYTGLSKQVGLIVNDKTIVSKHYGVYCEGDYIRVGKTLKRLPTFSIRSYVNGTIPSTDLINQYLARGVPREILLTVQQQSLTKWLALAKEHGVDPYMPEKFGGLGMMPPDMNAIIPREYSRIVQLAHNGQLPVLYTDITSKLKLAQRLKAGLSEVRQSVHGMEFADELYEEALGRMTAILEFRLALMGESSTRVDTPGRTVRRLKAFKKRCLGLGRDDHETTYAKAYEVLGRIHIETRSIRKMYVIT
jgi:hypothetical protein